jgi:hypothetical protein
MSKYRYVINGREDPLPEDWEWLHEVTLSDPQGWLIEAVNLKNAATVLVDRMRERKWPFRGMGNMASTNLERPALLLFGYSFECLVKGWLLDSNQLPSTDELKRLSHNYVSRLNGICTEEELELLGRLIRNVEWAGRYPAPNPNKAQQIKDKFLIEPVNELRDSDPELIEALFLKLVDRYSEDAKKIYTWLSKFSV